MVNSETVWWCFIYGLPLVVGLATAAHIRVNRVSRLLWGAISTLILFGLINAVLLSYKTDLMAYLLQLQNGLANASDVRISTQLQSPRESYLATFSPSSPAPAGRHYYWGGDFVVRTTLPVSSGESERAARRYKELNKKFDALAKQQAANEKVDMKREVEWLKRNVEMLRDDFKTQVDRLWTIMTGVGGGILVLFVGVIINAVARKG